MTLVLTHTLFALYLHTKGLKYEVTTMMAAAIGLSLLLLLSSGSFL